MDAREYLNRKGVGVERGLTAPIPLRKNPGSEPAGQGSSGPSRVPLMIGRIGSAITTS